MAVIVTSGVRADGFPHDTGYRNGFAFLMLAAISSASLACLLIPSSPPDEQGLLASAHVVEHGETAFIWGAGLIDVE